MSSEPSASISEKSEKLKATELYDLNVKLEEKEVLVKKQAKEISAKNEKN